MMNRSRVFILVSFSFIYSFLASQTINEWQVDGEIYLKYNNEYDISAITGKQQSNQAIAPSSAILPGLDEQFSKDFGIYKITAPFNAAFDRTLNQTIQVFFKDPAQINELIGALSALPYIDYAEPVPYNTTGLQPNDMQNNTTSGQWGLWKINAREAWDISTGDEKITVAIVDDGVSIFHPDLYDNIWRNPNEIAGNGIDDDNNGYIDDIYGWDAGNNDNNPVHPSTNFTHGTHVGGIAGAVTNNARGVASIGYNISIMPVKCTFDNQSSPTSIPNGYQGVVYAANAGADIVNCSWSSGSFSQTAQNTIDYVTSKGCIVVAAASNDGVNQIRYPAAYDGVIAVASSDFNDKKSSFSNYGTWVDITAPGSRIRSTIAQSNSYATFDGTSMATPMVAGLLGLMKSHNPNLSNAQLEQCLLDNSEDIYGLNPTFKGFLGKGRINAEKAMQCVDLTLKAKPKAEIKSAVTVTCPAVNIAFEGISTGGKPDNYTWYFEGGTPATSNGINPIVTYSAIGTYDVTLVLSNANGKDSITLPNYIDVAAQGRETVFGTDFENGTLSGMGFTIENPDNATTFDVVTVNGKDASTTKALRMSFYNYSATGERDAFITPVIDLSGNADVLLNFQHSYRARTSRKDSLLIYASTDSGKTFPYLVAAMAENGTLNFATNSAISSAFAPNNASDWCFETLSGMGCINVDLSNFDGEEYFALKFETYNGNGNNLFIDNINISAYCSGYNTKKPDGAFTNNDTSFCMPSSVKFGDDSKNFPTSRQWIFEGGTPATSTAKNPEVSYTTAGVYDVTLITSNAFGDDTLILKDYIVAQPAPLVTIAAGDSVLCRGESTMLYATGAPDFFWYPVFAISSTSGDSVIVNPPSSITYNVRGTSVNGCTNTKSIAIKVLPGPGVTSLQKVGDSLVASNSNSGVSFQWLFNGNPIPGEKGSTLKPSLEGNYAVLATDSLGCQNSSSNYFFSNVGLAGVDKSGVKLYPNPVNSDNLFIENYGTAPLSVNVFDNLGKRIVATELTDKVSTIDVSALKQGVYFITLHNNLVSITEKIIVTKE